LLAKRGAHRCEPRYNPGFAKIRSDCVHHAQRPERPKSDCAAIKTSKMRHKQGFCAQSKFDDDAGATAVKNF